MTARTLLSPFLILLALSACAPDDPPHASRDTDATHTNSDSAFAAVQERGKGVMGVDQYTSQHVFEDLLDGGRVILERDDSTDVAGIAQIRQHMQDILMDFRNGDFSKPFGVHAMEVPGTQVMSARRDSIQYDVIERPRGAELRIATSDTVALAAVHRFLAFQRMDHRAAGHEGHWRRVRRQLTVGTAGIFALHELGVPLSRDFSLQSAVPSGAGQNTALPMKRRQRL